MNPISVIADALRSIPSRYRKAIYLAYALAVVGTGAAAVAHVDTGATADVLTYLAPFVGFTAASNTNAE
jgi:hypothetical protein